MRTLGGFTRSSENRPIRVVFMVFLQCAQVLLLCARGAEPRIAHARPERNDTAASTTAGVSAETNDDETVTTAATVTAAGTTVTDPRYADNDNSKSMSAKAELYGIQFYAPPIIHRPPATVPSAVNGDDVNVFGRVAVRHRTQSTPVAAYQYRHWPYQHHRQRQWTEPPTVPAAGDNNGGGDRDGSEPALMNPLLAAYGDPSTVRYSAAAKSSRRPVTRLVKYAEPAALAYQLPYLAAETDDGALVDSLPALQLALQHHPHRLPVYQPLHVHHQHNHAPHPHHHHHHHQLQHQQQHPHQPQQQQQQQQHHYPHAHHQPHRYAPARYTQVPFLYNVPAPPTLHVQRYHHRHHHPPPTSAEYDLVTRFNRLLKEREREDLRRGAAAAAAAEQIQEQPDETPAEDEEEETTARPVKNSSKKNKKKRKKKKKKKRPPPSTTPEPAPVVENEDEDEEKQPVKQYDERSDDEPETSEEQESQNVQNREKWPAETSIHETEADYQNQNTVDGPSEISEHFGGDLKFDDTDGERVEFQLHGLGGPESYKFGYDTGKGTNRQFRYEERDNGGYVRGHYGYLDQDGKMQVYNYSSHPELGFQSQKAETRDEQSDGDGI